MKGMEKGKISKISCHVKFTKCCNFPLMLPHCISADSRRAVVSFWQKNMHNTG